MDPATLRRLMVAGWVILAVWALLVGAWGRAAMSALFAVLWSPPVYDRLVDHLVRQLRGRDA